MKKLVFVTVAALIASVACGGGEASPEGAAESVATQTAAPATQTAAPATATPEDIGSGDVFALEIGQCFDDPDTSGTVTAVDMVDCSDPHDNEVYALFDMPDSTFPGLSVVKEAAADGCYNAFEPHVGLDYESSVFDFSWLAPTPNSWENGDHEIVCIAYDLDLKKLTETVKNSGM